MNEVLHHDPDLSLGAFLDRLHHLIRGEHPLLGILKKNVIRLFVRERANGRLDPSLGLDQTIWHLATRVFARLREWFVRGEHERLLADFYGKVQVQPEMAMMAAILLNEPMRELEICDPITHRVVVMTMAGDYNKSELAELLGITRYKVARHLERGIKFCRNHIASKERQQKNGSAS